MNGLHLNRNNSLPQLVGDIMSTFTFNGVSSDTLGLIVTKTPVPPCQQEMYETIYIPGGNTVHNLKKYRQNVSILIETTVIEPDRLRDIYSTFQGTGKLILSNEPDKYYKAVCRPLSPQNIALYMNSIAFEFECEPFAYSVNNEPVEYTSHEIWLTNSGTYYCQPIYKLYGNGNLTLVVNNDINNTFTVYDVDEYVTVDAEKLLVHKNGTFLKSKGKLPFLNIGDNRIQTNAIKIEITKNERWI